MFNYIPPPPVIFPIKVTAGMLGMFSHADQKKSSTLSVFAPRSLSPRRGERTEGKGPWSKTDNADALSLSRSLCQRHWTPLVIVKDQSSNLVYLNICIKQQTCENLSSIGRRSCKIKMEEKTPLSHKVVCF